MIMHHYHNDISHLLRSCTPSLIISTRRIERKDFRPYIAYLYYCPSFKPDSRSYNHCRNPPPPIVFMKQVGLGDKIFPIKFYTIITVHHVKPDSCNCNHYRDRSTPSWSTSDLQSHQQIALSSDLPRYAKFKTIEVV